MAQDDKNESLTLRSQKKLVKARIHKLNIELANKHEELEQMTERIVNLIRKFPRTRGISLRLKKTMKAVANKPRFVKLTGRWLRRF